MGSRAIYRDNFFSMLCMIETRDINLFCVDYGPKLTDIGEVTKICSKNIYFNSDFFVYIVVCYVCSQTVTMLAFRQLYCLVTSSVTYEQLLFFLRTLPTFSFNKKIRV
jgi:hypothetical protein